MLASGIARRFRCETLSRRPVLTDVHHASPWYFRMINCKASGTTLSQSGFLSSPSFLSSLMYSISSYFAGYVLSRINFLLGAQLFPSILCFPAPRAAHCNLPPELRLLSTTLVWDCLNLGGNNGKTFQTCLPPWFVATPIYR